MNKVTKNTFFKGRNTDQDPSILEPAYYTEAHNVSLVGDNAFFALQNIKGTTDIVSVINAADSEILRVIGSRYTIADVEEKECLTIFTATLGGNFTIWCYDIDGDVLYKLFEEAVSSDYFTDDRIIDAKVYGERGIDIIYFTDNYNETRQLRCQITTAQAATPTVAFLSAYDLSLQKRGANGKITLDTVDTGGSLLSGSYQFAYRMIDITTARSTKWSSLTLPITAFNIEQPGSNPIAYAGIGLYTDRKITITISPSQDELDNFNYFQLAVIENIYPTGAQDETFVASILPVEPIANLTGYEYKSNTKIGTIPISEITVDLAPIKTAKTINIDRNRLYKGNLEYWNREYDNGEPTITSGSVTVTSTNPAVDGQERTYIRGEVYRFAIVYEDAFGNKSAPKPLDMTTIGADNQISGALDMKFPTRDTGGTYAIPSTLTPSTLAEYNYLGLQLNDIINHPTWAVAFEIVRAKRIPRVLFQTPLIPMMSVQGIGALRDYPTVVYTSASSSDTVTSAEPMTSSKVFVPKNLLWPELRDIKKRTVDGGGTTYQVIGETILERSINYDLACIFPPTLYGIDYIPTGNEEVETVDFILLYSVASLQPDLTKNGNDIETSLAATLSPIQVGDYYYDPSHVKTPITDSNRKITDYQYFDNLSTGGTVGGEKVLQYNELSTKGVTWGYEPTVSKMAVIKLSDEWEDEGSRLIAFNSFTHNAYSGGSSIISGLGGFNYESTATNSLITGYTGYTSGSPFQVVRVVNVINASIGDSRYGNIDDQHEYISTGARYTFNPSELSQVAAGTSTPVSITVGGGDASISQHVHKVCDSTYAVVNQEKQGVSGLSKSSTYSKWGKFYLTGGSSGLPLSIPVALKNSGQFLQIALENTYIGQVLDKDVLERETFYDIFFKPPTEASIRAPLTYKYNQNLSKQNDQKVYFPLPEVNFIQNVFKARGIYSDQKIYNTSESGFDTFRVLNTFDLEESGGGITGLVKDGDKFYAIQERRISYLPTGQTVLEQTDASTLAVGTADVIGRVMTIDPKRGGQHLSGIVETGSSVYIVDNENKAVYRLAGQQLEFISALNNDVKFREMLDDSVPEKNILSIYDPTRKEYWFVDNLNNECHVFSEVLNSWIANYEFSSTAKLTGGTYADQKLYLTGNVSDQHSLHTMYTGDINQLFGETVVPRVTFVVNPDSDFAKTFDDQAIIATDRLATVDWDVAREQSLGNQTVSGTVIDVDSVEGNYRIKTLRDNLNARLRGLRLTTTIKWKDTLSKLSSVITKYRPSSRNPF